MFALRFLDKEMPVPVVHVSLFNSNTHCKVKKRSSSIVKVPAILKKEVFKKGQKRRSRKLTTACCLDRYT